VSKKCRGTFLSFTGTACTFGAAGASCKESLTPQGLTLAPYIPPLANKACCNGIFSTHQKLFQFAAGGYPLPVNTGVFPMTGRFVGLYSKHNKPNHIIRQN
jgi:hypothetical protein